MTQFLRITILCLTMLATGIASITGINTEPPSFKMKAEILSGNQTTLLDNGSTNHGTVIIGGIHIHQK